MEFFFCLWLETDLGGFHQDALNSHIPLDVIKMHISSFLIKPKNPGGITPKSP